MDADFGASFSLVCGVNDADHGHPGGRGGKEAMREDDHAHHASDQAEDGEATGRHALV